MRFAPERLARASARHPWRTVVVWAALVAGAAVASSALLGSALTTQGMFTNRPESLRAQDLLEQRLTGPSKDTELVIVRSTSRTLDDAVFMAYMSQLQANVLGLGPSFVTGAPIYFRPERNPLLMSRDGRAAVMPVTFAGDFDMATANIGKLRRIVTADHLPGFQVLIAGQAQAHGDYSAVANRDMATSERIGIVAALLVLLVVFGAVVAAVLPLGLALVAIAVAMGIVGLLGLAFNFTFFVTNIITMMGLAVAIDYSLFIVSRFREERRDGLDKPAAIEKAGATASRAVLFSGMTVVLALSGMMLIPVTVFRSIGAGSILVVIAAVAAALTLLPALLSLLGDRIEKLRVLRRRDRVPDPDRGFWGRIARRVMARPVTSLVAGTAVLVVLALSFFRMETGSSGVSTLPAGTESKQAFEVLSREFAGGMSDPIKVVVDGKLSDIRVRDGISSIQTLLRSDRGLGRSSLAVNQARNLALISVPVIGDPNGRAATATVWRIRDRYVPEAFAGSGARVLVGGVPAFNADFFAMTDNARPAVFAFVLGLSFLLLLLAFRSLVVPAKAILLNLLSVGAAYGMVVLVFQKGGPAVGKWIADAFGFQQVEVIEAWLPLFLFTILFGLSMDYHVFLLSRIRERFVQTGDNTGSVAFGLSRTGGIITGAALIMVAVFGGFALGNLVMMQQIGFGLAVAILLDATIVRIVLVPSAMKLLGDVNWYLPKWLQWLPRLSVEGPSAEPAPELEQPAAA